MYQSKLTGAARARQEGGPLPPAQQVRSEKEKQKTIEAVTQRVTRSTESDGSPLSRTEIEKMDGQEVTDAKKGMSYLESTLLTVPGVPYTAETLVGALFQISMLPGIKGSRANTNAVRAVAFLLADVNLASDSQAIADSVTSKLDEQLSSFREEAATAVHEIHNKLTEATVALKEQLEEPAELTLDGMKTAAQGVNENMAKLSEMTTKYRDALLRSGN
jgi:hypothetical protein